jgi:hypothetical protein
VVHSVADPDRSESVSVDLVAAQMENLWRIGDLLEMGGLHRCRIQLLELKGKRDSQGLLGVV